MLTLKERKHIQHELPHGSSKEIALLAGVNIVSVSRWFNSESKSCCIEDAVISLYGKFREEREKKLKSIGLR